METNKLLVVLLPAVIVVILFTTVFIPARRNKGESESIYNFEECIAAGYPAMESYPRQCRTKEGKHFVEELDQPIQASDTGTPTPFDENWITYTNQELGISFPYPKGYELSENQATDDSYYISIISPLDPDKPPKQTTLNENELKIEIITEPSVDEDSSAKCYLDHTENPNILSQSEIVISGVDAVQFDWEGLGDGQFVCVIKGDTRYLIIKYPLETKLQNDYEIFLDSILIND